MDLAARRVSRTLCALVALASLLTAPPASAEDAPSAGSPAGAFDWTAPIRVAGSGPAYLNLSLDALFAVGTSSEEDVTTLELGGHDPSQRGFTVQNVEVVFDGAVDPYLRGAANIIFQIDPEGETVVELEEAYLVTQSLPADLQVKAGQFFTEFGRHNIRHPHQWDFVDVPLVNGRLLGGDGLRGPGARLSWLMPLPFYSELIAGVHNSQGETAASFRNENEGEPLFGRIPEDRGVNDLGDMLWSGRWASSLDVTDEQTLVLGFSGVGGPNATGANTHTQIYGADLFWKWKSPRAEQGFPFASFTTELLYRRYQAGAFEAEPEDPEEPPLALPHETLDDWGLYAQASYGFTRGWVAGLRGDYVDGSDGAFEPDPDRSQRVRVSPVLTWYPTEFSKLRLQYNLDRVEDRAYDHSIWLQAEFLIGSHAAHTF